ncbi:TRAP transporter TatT component family protein [Elusimicrobiota bacterium]
MDKANMRCMRFSGLLVIGLCAVLSGCSLKTIALKSSVDLMNGGISAFYEEEDLELAEQAMGSNIKLLETFLKNDPDNEKLLLLTCQGFGGYAFLFIEDKAPRRASRFYERAKNYGKKLLTKKGFAPDTWQREAQVDEILKKATVKDVPAFFWTSYSWVSWINLNKNSPEAIIDTPFVVKMVKRMAELDPSYEHGVADALLGSYYASRSRLLGGDPEKAKEHFDKAIKTGGGKFLLTYVLYAQMYAYQMQDKELFENLLGKVMDAPTDILPEQNLSNRVAKQKARNLLEKINELF